MGQANKFFGTVFLAIILSSLFFFGCTQYPTTGPDATNQSNQSSTKSVAISINNFAFDPSFITVDAGTKVTWTNKDSAPHTVSSEEGIFESGTLGKGNSFSYTFDTPGEYNYKCNFHPSMTAMVVVRG